ncbi:MAG: carboxypeptidase regulatory-like domain-containing protein [Candidatus Acidiferrales bacterium]
MKLTKNLFFVVCAFVALFLCAGARAQTFERGRIHGTVLDAQNAAVPKAKVTLTNPSVGLRRETVSGGDGSYSFDEVPPGEYTLQVEREGFATTTVKAIELNVGGSVNVDVAMPLKTQQATVTVTAANATQDTPVEGISQLLNAQSVSNLPFAGRDYRDLAQLTPSAQVVPGLRGGLRLGGQQSDYSGLTIDGADNRNNFFGEFFGSLETKNFTVPLEAVQEFQVITNGFAPEFGRSSGGLLNVVTKSGTNEWHGEGHEYFRSSNLTANDALGNASNIDKQNQFGGSLGFPIHKDRQFFFGSFDVQREHGPLKSVFGTSGVGLNTITGPTIAASSTNGVLPPTCGGKTGAAALPTCYGASTLADLTGANTQFQNLATVLGHYDWQMTPANHFFVRGYWTRNHTDGFTGGRGQNELAAAFSNTENFHNEGVNGVFGFTTALGNKVNEIRVLVSGETRPRHPNGTQPEVNIVCCADFGQRFFLPINNDNGKLQAVDNFSYTFGKHDMKWGGDADAFVDRKDIFAGWSSGEYLFGSLQDFQNNNPFGFIQGFGLNGKPIFAADILAPAYQVGSGLFWQDKWQAAHNVTITYGLRYDATWNPQPQTPTPGAAVFVGQGAGSHLISPPQRIPNDLKQWGPRLGFSWGIRQGEHASVVRAAWGLYYGESPSIFFPQGGNEKGTTLFCFSGTSCMPNGGFPYLFPSSLPANTNLCLSPEGCPGVNYVDPNFRNPRVSNLTVGLEQQLGGGWVASVNYAFVHGDRLRTGGFSTTIWSRNVVVDHVDQFGRSILKPSNGLNGCPGFGPQPVDCTIGQANELGSFGRSNYHEFVASVNKRFAHRYQLFANYTWSRNFDDASSERDTDTFFGPQDPFNINLDYGRSGLDITHQFKAAWVADLPWGFTWSANMIAHSGFAYPAYILTDVNGDGVSNQGIGTNDRPIVQIGGGKPFLLPRYPARQPSFFQWNMRINKDFKITERYHAQLIADLFNLTNRGNLFSNPDNTAFINSGCSGSAPNVVCVPLSRFPQPGDQTPFGPPVTYRTLDQVSPGGTPFAFQAGFRFSF